MRDSKQFLSLLFAGMNQRKLEDFSEVLAEEAVFHFPKTAPIQGKKRIVSFLKILFRKYPSLTFTVGRLTGDTTVGAAEWTNCGRTKNGAVYENAGATFIEVRDEKIVYISDTFKDTGTFS